MLAFPLTAATVAIAAVRVNASIRYISPQASYTPPVIYSNENADKLTFRVEGVLNTADNMPNLQVGQPVQVILE